MRSNNTTVGFWVTLALTSFTMLSSATQAAEPSDTLPHQVVSFKDLNLNSAEGVTVLYERIRSAAKGVCGGVDVRDLRAVHAAKDCMEKAESRAILAVNSPMLTKLSLAKTGRTEKQLIAHAR